MFRLSIFFTWNQISHVPYMHSKVTFILFFRQNKFHVYQNSDELFYHPFMEECQTRRDMKESEVDIKKINPKKDKNGE
jgi:hypothetical protein